MGISHKINDTLYLVQEYVGGIGTYAPVTKPKAVNHLFIFDVSGSMWGQIEKVKEHVKNKLPSLVNPGDTISAIWFSGRGDFGALLEQAPIDTVADIARVNEAFEKWLRPRGATGFKEPLLLAAKLAGQAKDMNPWSVIFMSDGQDNAWPRADLFKAIEETGKAVASVTIVEYGFYADRAFLAQMAAKVGGSHVFAEDFRNFAPVFDAAMGKKVSSEAKVKLRLSGDVVQGIAWRVDTTGKEITSYAVDGDAVEVPADTSSIFYLTPKPITEEASHDHGSWKEGRDEALPGLYAAFSLFGALGKPDLLLALLKASGDVRLIRQFTNCFGKQKYSEFQAEAEASAFNQIHRLMDGFNPDAVPSEDAFTVIELLRLLAEDDGNRVLLDSKNFKYKRIGREIKANDDALKFVADWNPTGYSVRNLVFNEERPNVSIGVVKTGTVDLALEPGVITAGVPIKFPTQVHRNYAIIKDGLVNVDLLPVRMTKATFNAVSARIPNALQDPYTVMHNKTTLFKATINLRSLPVINRKMVRELSAEDFFTSAYETMRAKAAQKVFGHYYDEFNTKAGGVRTSEGMEAKYGTAGAAWLRERGLTDHGFAPRGTSVDATDFYMGKELSVSLSGLSSLPTVDKAKLQLAKAAEDRKAKGDKAKPAVISARLMEPFIAEVEDMLGTKRPDAIKKAWLDTQQSIWRGKARKGMANTAQDMICVTVGQAWFREFKSLEENSLTIKTADGPIACKVDQREIQVNI